ncbi:MAG: hypothetical protein GEV08_23010 [Acidimicrobiia bacterium]|nr:hypothetical protein [Actinophytocola sp.]MPY95818.1 hypothetical protein [Acidimicrobiia bacterium]
MRDADCEVERGAAVGGFVAKRRSRGDGGPSWDKPRQRWAASITVGYTSAGQRRNPARTGRGTSVL